MDTHIKFDRKLETKDLIYAILFVMPRKAGPIAKRTSWARLDARKGVSPLPDRPRGSYNSLGTPCSIRIFYAYDHR
jgi:hypothetical protein